MSPKTKKLARGITSSALILLAVVIASAQTSSVESRIAGPIDDSQRVTLHGNVYPLARPEFDRGTAPASLAMEHMWLVLKRSPAQESALEALLAQQENKTSPNYHKWLTPAEFGLQFGPSSHDIGAVVQWLASHGLGVSKVTNGRIALEFSGTAASVQQAFHTEIHMYEVNGKQHYANATDPEIPSALEPVVSGVNALHDFKKHPASHRVVLSANGIPLRRVKPNFTFPSNCDPTTTCNFGLGPGDFSTIYNVAAANEDGTGQTIAVLGQATVNPADITTFRQLFGVESPSNGPQILDVPGDAPPSLSESAATGDESESDLDLEWSGSVAPEAHIIFVTSSNVDDSATYAVDNNVAPIIGLSYGLCEFQNSIGDGNDQFNQMWQQAATQGQTVVVSTGDDLASGCETASDNATVVQPASTGLAVSGLASPVYDLSVGGTDFNDLSNPSTYWNTSNSGSTQVSAKSYIPETTYNDSCTNAILGEFSGYSTIPLANCNSATINALLVAPFGGNGGMSNCTAPTGSSSVTQCAGGWAKPTWQSAPGVPNDGKRDLPDVSMFAGDGFTGSFYMVCESDLAPADGSECDLGNSGNDISGFGGTSAAAQAMAGVIALVKQKNSPNTGMGLVNPTLYELASDQASLSCNSSSPAGNCVFNQVTVGTIAPPCEVGSPDCGVTASGNSIGILSGCDTSTGYNLATGLGSVNVGNLVNSWSTATANSTADFQLSLQNCNATANITSPGGSGSIGLTITPVNGFTGTYTISCSGLPSESTCSSTQTASGAVTNVTVTVATTANSNAAPFGFPRWPGWVTKIGIPFAAFAMFFFVMSRLFRWSRRRAIGFSMAAALILFMAACGGGGNGGGGGGGGSGGTPTGYVSGATVSVMSGSTTHSMTFNVNVE